MNEVADRRPRIPWFVAFLGRRLVWAVITSAILIGVILFVMEVWVPYSWADRFTNSDLLEAELREILGLDRPLPIRYLEYLAGLLRGSLGESFSGASVADMLRNALPVTLTVFVIGTLVGWIVGELLGRIGGWTRSRLAGPMLTIVGISSVAIFPPFLVFVLVAFLRRPLLDLRETIGLPTDSLDLWRDYVTEVPGALSPTDVRWAVALTLCVVVVGALVARAFARRQGLRLAEILALPMALVGAGLALWLGGIGPHALDLLYRVEMSVTTGRGSPALALVGIALISFGQIMLMMRAGMHAQRTEDYVLTGRAKGLPEHVVRDRHAARNAVAPVLAGSFLAFPTILAGMMLVEYELQMAGISSVLFSAVELQDIPVIMGVLVVLGLIGVGFRLVTDISMAVLDPRLRVPR